MDLCKCCPKCIFSSNRISEAITLKAYFITTSDYTNAYKTIF